VPFDAEHVIGLADHHLLTFTQLVIEVPANAEVNPDIRATRLSFHPRHGAQLHNYSSNMQRVIVPVFTSGGITSERASSVPPRERPNESTVDHRAAGQSGQAHGQHQPDRYGEPCEKAKVIAPVASVPPLAFAKPPQIGSPFNAETYSRNSQWTQRSNEVDVIIAGRGVMQDGCRPRPDACVSRFPSPDLPRAPLTPLGQRSVSLSSRAAAVRVAAFRAEASMAPYVKRVAEGYVLLPEEMQRMRQLADVIQRRPPPSPTFLHGSAATYSGPLPSEQIPFCGSAGSSCSPTLRSSSARPVQIPIAAGLEDEQSSRIAGATPGGGSSTERARSRRVSLRSRER